MVQNSKEGTANYTNGANKYYTSAQRDNACPSSDWSVPNTTQWAALQKYINGSATTTEKQMWNSGAALAGYYNGSQLLGSGTHGGWWCSDPNLLAMTIASGGQMTGPNGNVSSYSFPVRCVKN
jgi:uncharacterized protein (TIGR02145 family)